MSAAAVQEVPAVEPRKKYGPFKVLAGSHVEDHPAGGKTVNGRNREILYNVHSEPFYSNSDLTQLNAPNMSPKFHLVGSAQVQLHTPLTQAPGESNEAYAARLRKLSEDAMKLAGIASPAPQQAAAVLTAEQINGMTLAQLQKMAEEEEVDLKGAKSAAEAAKIIKASFGIK
jgi:hypothetical protein